MAPVGKIKADSIDTGIHQRSYLLLTFGCRPQSCHYLCLSYSSIYLTPVSMHLIIQNS